MKKLLFLIIIFSACSARKEKINTQTINVGGNAEIEATPNIAVARFSFDLNSGNKQELLSNLSQSVSGLTGKVKKLGVDTSEIVINNLNIDWNYIYDKAHQLTGIRYSASQEVDVRIDFNKMNIEGIFKIVQEIPKVNFSVDFELSQSKQDSIKKELIKLALKDGERKAKTIADAERLSILGIQNISYHFSNADVASIATSNANNMVAYDMVSVKGELKLTPEKIKLDDNVEIIYLVKNR